MLVQGAVAQPPEQLFSNRIRPLNKGGQRLVDKEMWPPSLSNSLNAGNTVSVGYCAAQARYSTGIEKCSKGCLHSPFPRPNILCHSIVPCKLTKKAFHAYFLPTATLLGFIRDPISIPEHAQSRSLSLVQSLGITRNFVQSGAPENANALSPSL